MYLRLRNNSSVANEDHHYPIASALLILCINTFFYIAQSEEELSGAIETPAVARYAHQWPLHTRGEPLSCSQDNTAEDTVEGNREISPGELQVCS